MNRRTFLYNTGIAASAMLLFPKWVLARGSKDVPCWEQLIDYARWCPSPHNVQPWKMKIISFTEAHLYYDPARLPVAVDSTSSFTTAGMGMFVECLDIAARHEGFEILADYGSGFRLDATATGYQKFARLHLVQTNEKITTDRELIKKRKTSRLTYDGRIIDPDIITSYKNSTSAWGHEFHYSSDPGLIDYTIDLNTRAILSELDDKPAMEEMSRWIRCSDKEAENKKDGLSNRCMAVSGKDLHNFFFKPGSFRSRIKYNYALQRMNKGMHGTANIAWLTGPYDTRQDWINAGRMLQRLWLEATKDGIYMQPLGTIVTVAPHHETFRKKLNCDESKGTLWLLLRLGYGEDPPRSFRLDTKDIIIA